MRCNLVTREEGATQFCVYFNNSDKTEKKNEFYAYREKERGGFCWKNPDIPLFSKEFKRKTTAEIAVPHYQCYTGSNLKTKLEHVAD
ncbi:hypothetical protein P5673_017830 [Acropora cervicornis]|uniref:Uncharacterized protein n=1 Tax=Acropora cervicornis TaxID=6130 RepID=A0AAD9QEA5_ACRCE|nr:hypothetical protein P5673_017830 [Acropora cervicornis]